MHIACWSTWHDFNEYTWTWIDHNFFIPHVQASYCCFHSYRETPTNNSRQARIKLPKRRRPGFVFQVSEDNKASNYHPGIGIKQKIHPEESCFWGGIPMKTVNQWIPYSEPSTEKRKKNNIVCCLSMMWSHQTWEGTSRPVHGFHICMGQMRPGYVLKLHIANILKQMQ